jgi:hypothetical protein
MTQGAEKAFSAPLDMDSGMSFRIHCPHWDAGLSAGSFIGYSGPINYKDGGKIWLYRLRHAFELGYNSLEKFLSSHNTPREAMSNRALTQQQVESRLEMDEEAAEHLEQSVCDTEEEKIQARIVSAQIRAMARKFENKFYADKK